MSMLLTPEQRCAAGLIARRLMAQLHESLTSDGRYTNAEMEISMVRVRFSPNLKAVLGKVAELERESMAEFVRIATIERAQRLLGARITESDGDESDAA